jgi:hypothetical protein
VTRVGYHPQADQELSAASFFYHREAHGLVIYEVHDDQLWILAVAHQRREPGY